MYGGGGVAGGGGEVLNGEVSLEEDGEGVDEVGMTAVDLNGGMNWGSNVVVQEGRVSG